MSDPVVVALAKALEGWGVWRYTVAERQAAALRAKFDIRTHEQAEEERLDRLAELEGMEARGD